MNYLGTHPLEGATLVASSNITSDTSSVTMTGIFESETMYFIHFMDIRPKDNQYTLQYRWLDSSDNAITFTNMQEGGRYGFTGGGGSTGNVYNVNRTHGYVNIIGGIGKDSDEHGMAEMWCVPNTTQEKMAYHSGHYHNGSDEVYMHHFGMGTRLNTSATAAHGIEFVANGSQLNNATIRVYKLADKINPLRSLKRRHTDNWVDSNYIGGAIKGQGWAKVAQMTASDGDSALDFTDVFTSDYKRYVITGTDCRPSTDNTNLIFQYRDADGLNTGTYNSAFFSADANGGTGSGHADDQTVGLVLNAIGTNGREAGNFIAYLDPTNALTPKLMGYRSYGQMQNEETRSIVGAVAYNDATVMTGIKWYWSSGNWESGTIKIYGVND